MTTRSILISHLEQALAFRQPLLDSLGPAPAIRLFNGFWEGWPGLAVELYHRTLVILLYEEAVADGIDLAQVCLDFYPSSLPGMLDGILLKERFSSDPRRRQGFLLSTPQSSTSDKPSYPRASQVQEHGVLYALDLQLHQDTSLYLDTRQLRLWAAEHLNGAHVLNTFAYTGSLGAAARAADALNVIQTDLSSDFLALARRTFHLNGWDMPRGSFITGDFFSVVAHLKQQNRLFDCVVLDPPIFSVTAKGRVDMLGQYTRLINKVRPLVAHGGALVAVNNAVYMPGEVYLSLLQDLCSSGYMEIESFIPVPPDFTGYAQKPIVPLPADPAPFNHSTKIAVLRLSRKDLRRAQ
jgi:23S rRNA (cytosine1962-C5)-methyltransferase